MGRCRRDKVHLTVAQRENFEQISGEGFITEYANRHNTLIVISGWSWRRFLGASTWASL